jgi:hypothetical protein
MPKCGGDLLNTAKNFLFRYGWKLGGKAWGKITGTVDSHRVAGHAARGANRKF